MADALARVLDERPKFASQAEDLRRKLAPALWAQSFARQ